MFLQGKPGVACRASQSTRLHWPRKNGRNSQAFLNYPHLLIKDSEKTMRPKEFIAFSVTALLLMSCTAQSGQLLAKVDQSSVCRFDSNDTAKQCKERQLAFFQPDTFGNEQLPLVVAATYCDFDYPVIHNRAGVVCVFTSQRMKQVQK